MRFGKWGVGRCGRAGRKPGTVDVPCGDVGTDPVAAVLVLDPRSAFIRLADASDGSDGRAVAQRSHDLVGPAHHGVPR